MAANTHAANFESSNEVATDFTGKAEEIHRNRVIMSKSPNIFAQFKPSNNASSPRQQSVFPSVNNQNTMGDYSRARNSKLDKQVT